MLNSDHFGVKSAKVPMEREWEREWELFGCPRLTPLSHERREDARSDAGRAAAAARAA